MQCRLPSMPAHRRSRCAPAYGSPKAVTPSRPAGTPVPSFTPLPAPVTSLPNLTPSPTVNPSVSDLLSQSRLTSEEWYRSPRTTKAYAGYVKSGKIFLDSWADEATFVAGGPDIVNDDSEDKLGFARAFDEISSRTPLALRLLTAYKCDHQGKGFSTAEGLRSAFKSYFERCVDYSGPFSTCSG